MNHIMDQFKAGGAPQKYISEKAAHVADKITDEPGLKVIVPDVNDIRHEPGQGIAPGSINVLETAKSLADQVHGMQDASRGAPQPGVNSGLMLDGFVEAAQTRPRLKNRSVDEFMRQIGYLTASRYLQFYTAKRTFRITNKEGFDEFVEFNIDGEGDNRTVNISRQAYDKSGKKVGVPRQTTGSARGLPDIDIVAGSNLPYARAQKTATAGSLYDRNVITRLSYLEAIDWPNAKEEDKRVQEQQDAAIQAKAQAQVA